MSCCAKFTEQSGRPQVPVGGGGLYPAELRPNAQFEQKADGAWNVNGCCGGGCYVIEKMEFCPYCGTRLSAEKPDPSAAQRVGTYVAEEKDDK